MSTRSKLAALREHHYALASLSDTVWVPALGARRNETIKPVESATVDDLAFALLRLNERASALYREIEALRTIHDEARRVGALGADIAVDAVSRDAGER
jgi:hypothetical protein